MSFLRHLLGIRPKVVGGTPLTPTAADLLWTDFDKLEREQKGIAERMYRYALTGEDEAVLATLAGITQAGRHLVLLCPARTWNNHRDEISKERRAFFSEASGGDGRFYLRLARIYEAAARGEPRQFGIEPWNGLRLEWPEIFLFEATQYVIWSYPRKAKARLPEGARVIEEMFREDGQEPALLVRAALNSSTAQYAWSTRAPMFLELDGIGDCFVRHADVACEILGTTDARARLHALETLRKSGAPPEPFAARLAELAVGSAKQPRAIAAAWLLESPAVARPLVERLLAAGDAGQRGQAAALLWRLAGEETRGVLEARLGVEKNRAVVETIADLLGRGTAAGNPSEGDATANDFEVMVAALPPVPEFAADEPLSAEVRSALWECIAALHRRIEAAEIMRLHRSHAPTLQDQYDPDLYVNRVFDWLQRPLQPEADGRLPRLELGLMRYWAPRDPTVWKFLDHPGMGLVHVVRFLLGSGIPPHGQLFLHALPRVFHRLGLRPDVRTLAAAARAAGIVGDAHEQVADGVLRRGDHLPAMFPGEPDAEWPFFAGRLPRLETALGLRQQIPTADERAASTWETRNRITAERANGLRLLAAMPVLPPHLAAVLWDVAFGENKAERAVARQHLGRRPGSEARILAALGSEKADARALAADWLGQLGNPATVDPLRAALKKEKHDSPKIAMMQALEALGAPIEEFLDRAGLEREAARGLARGVPSGLAWFPFDPLPAVRWADGSRPVSPEVLRWFVVQAFQTKNPEPNALLRRYCASFEPAGREALGRFVLQAWIAQDTIPYYTPEQAQIEAEKQVNQWYSPGYLGRDWTREECLRFFYLRNLRLIKDSAVAQKGVLAIAAACAGGDAVPIVGAYLKEWFGHRASQCRALLQVLAWIEHPTAIQLLLSVGTRFRTKGIQEEAAALVETLAARKGWTLDELADRTAPTAGFDENGALELSYGARQFTARLDDDFNVTLTNADGKTLATLPAPNRDDDEEQTKLAKARFSAARKELKGAVKAQAARLYEGMCAQRAWRFADWDRFLLRHPVVGRLAQRLVWTAFEDGRPVRSFRPLADRTLTDARDEAVTVPPGAEVRVAHGTFLAPEETAAWREHFADYEVDPLFVQFPDAAYVLPPDGGDAEGIDDFQGHVLEAFRLRSLVTKLGYVRGTTEDGGWFSEYRKSFLGLALEVVIGFTGNSLPEENRKVALLTLKFVRRATDDGRPEEAVPLGQVPPVLRSEAWNELRRLAAEGSGFAPDWQKQCT